MLRFDHLGIAARDPHASANLLAELLAAGTPTPDGADEDMFRIDLDEGAFVLFSQAPEGRLDVVHVAFHVDDASFSGIVGRLREREIPFGNDPEDPRNGRTDDPLGGKGRVYFVDPDGHLFEITC